MHWPNFSVLGLTNLCSAQRAEPRVTLPAKHRSREGSQHCWYFSNLTRAGQQSYIIKQTQPSRSAAYLQPIWLHNPPWVLAKSNNYLTENAASQAASSQF